MKTLVIDKKLDNWDHLKGEQYDLIIVSKEVSDNMLVKEWDELRWKVLEPLANKGTFGYHPVYISDLVLYEDC